MENIYTAAEPFYILSKVLGLFPMSKEGPTAKGLFRLKWHGIVSCLVSFIVPIALIALTIFFDNPDSWLSKVWSIYTNFGTTWSFLNFFFQIIKHESAIKFLDAVNQFDQKVNLSCVDVFLLRDLF